jgi:hypothetical protein
VLRDANLAIYQADQCVAGGPDSRVFRFIWIGFCYFWEERA